ncbi:MAG TPA: B12-binding domain-containing protein [Baekduia sp.]|uniref:cobalamin B12-binding domain-containing protein n=1 Tax=Baekduia sp. TaxID=2600305 RepID=UPI002D79BBE6|nr:B12-binding domain-containing protein [Baekduia sp.]HET6506893.1 B12-binding domain-containing protein [Baekduia sp.]
MTGRTSSAAGTVDLGEVRRRYLEHLLAPDARGAWDAIATALDGGARAEQVYLDVLTPAMVEIGQLWETARIGVAQEHLATQITQTVLARLAPSLEDAAAAFAGGRRRRAIVAGTPGELHGIGARMVADFLEASGWDVLLLGPDTPVGEIVALAARREPDVVALSTSLSFNLLAAGHVFARLRELDAPPLLIAGGRAYEGHGDRALLAGADVFAADPEALLRELALRLH